MMKWFWMVLVIVACSATSSEAQTYEKVTPDKLEELLKTNKEIQLVDVRTPDETFYGIIPDAQQIDYNSPKFNEMVSKLDKSKPVAVYCAVGGRSAGASEKLKKLGFIKVYDLSGGYKAWTQAGKSVQK